MTPEYQFYHGALLHELIITVGREIRIALRDFHGRPNAYSIDDQIGLLLKHSAARISPWTFTFTKEQIAELHSLRQATKVCFVGFVCGDDGYVCIKDSDLVAFLKPTDGDVASVRIERRTRRMYTLSSGGTDMHRKVPNGLDELLAEIRLRSTECALPSS